MNADNLNMSFNHEVFDRGKLWQDGWYIYSQGEVTGPFKAEHVFGDKKPNFDGELISVSRKGLSRWYEYRSLRKIFWDQAELKDGKKREKKAAWKIARNEPKKKPVSQKKVQSKHLGIKKAKSSLKVKNEVSKHEKKKFEKSSSLRQVKKPSKDLVKSEIQSLAYYHLVLKGRLRLGAFQNPLNLIFKMFLTFGYGWKTWFEQVMIECSYHIDDPNAMESLKGLWKVLIPGLHMFKVYALARLVLQMEVQNHYRRTSPLLSFVLSIVPPLAIIYLQTAINRHWRLHICHFVQNNKYTYK